MFDCHAHLTDPSMREGLDERLAEAEAAGVTGIVVVSESVGDAVQVYTRRIHHLPPFYPPPAQCFALPFSPGRSVAVCAVEPHILARPKTVFLFCLVVVGGSVEMNVTTATYQHAAKMPQVQYCKSKHMKRFLCKLQPSGRLGDGMSTQPRISILCWNDYGLVCKVIDFTTHLMVV